MENYVVLRPVQQRFSDLYLCYCGYEACDPLHAYGPAVRPNYLIHFVLEGRGIFRTEHAKWELSAGDGFLIEPQVQTFYQADEEEPWTYLWVGFDGRLAPDVAAEMGLGGEQLTFRSGRGGELKKIVFSMLRDHNFSTQHTYYLESQLYRFISTLLMDLAITLPTSRNQENVYVQAAVQFIQNNYHRRIGVREIADYVNVNRSYLYTLFKKETGVGPQEYLTTFRLSRAADLLNHSTYPIEVVALSSGYRDPLVFSKAFKAHYGTTPSGYRKRERLHSQGRREQNEEKMRQLQGR